MCFKRSKEKWICFVGYSLVRLAYFCIQVFWVDGFLATLFSETHVQGNPWGLNWGLFKLAASALIKYPI